MDAVSLAPSTEAPSAAADDDSKLGSLVLVKMSDYRVQNEECRAYDGFYLNHKGYKTLAFIMFEQLAPLIRTVEWKSWKELLAPDQQSI